MHDFNGNPLTYQSYKVFADRVASSEKEIFRLKDDQTMKEKLPYIISDKFRQLATALKFAIPDLVSYLPNQDNCGPNQILDQYSR